MKKLDHVTSDETIPSLVGAPHEPGRVRADADPSEFRNRVRTGAYQLFAKEPPRHV